MTDNTKEEDILKHQKEIDEDYELTRNVLKVLLQTNQHAIPLLSEVCKESQHPRSFEVLAKLTKDTADIADKLLDMQRKKQVVDTESAMNMLASRDNSDQPLITYTATERKFTGSTEEMQKKLKERIEIEKNKP